MNDDTLLLYYYNDGLSTRERRQVDAAINTDPDIAAQYEALCQQLNAMDDPEPHAVPSHMVQRWHDSIDRAAQQDLVSQRQPSRSFNLFSFAWGAAFAATLAIGISIGVYFSAAPLTAPTVIAENLAPPAAFTRGVSMYLRDTHQELATLPVATEPLPKERRWFCRSSSRTACSNVLRNKIIRKVWHECCARLSRYCCGSQLMTLRRRMLKRCVHNWPSSST